MTTQEKREIQWKLKVYVSSFSSQKKAVASIANCSEATIISMLGETETLWNGISEAMWRNVGAQVGGVVDFSRMVETRNLRTLIKYYQTARDEGATFAIIGAAGWGKTYTAKWFAMLNRKNNVYLLECSEYWDKKMFLQRLMMQMGRPTFGLKIGEMMEIIVRELRGQKNPVIIMDEVDKLTDHVFKFFITLYNELNKVCGFIWQSTDAIEKRMIRGIQRNTVGYQELFSRIGATFINLKQPTHDEIKEICRANGIDDETRLATIVNEVSEVRGDLRRVDRNLLKEKVKNQKVNTKTAA